MALQICMGDDLEKGLKNSEMQIQSPKSIDDDATLREASVQSPQLPVAAQDSEQEEPSQWRCKLQKGLRRFLQPKLATPTVRTLEDCQSGYPRLAAFLDSDENFMVYRRFGYIFSRLLLHKQSQLQKLEIALDEMDGDDCPRNLMGSDWLENPDCERAQLFQNLERKAVEYAQLLKHAKGLAATSRPSNFEYRSFVNYIKKERPLYEDEEPRIDLKEDLVTLRPGREHAWLDESIEYLLRVFHCDTLHNLFCSEETRQKTTGDAVRYYTRSRINFVASMVITIAILALFIAPIYILYTLTNPIKDVPIHQTVASCIGTLLVFTLAFSAVLSFFTRARRHEILGAAAAYCAVLVVFLSNVPSAPSPQ